MKSQTTTQIIDFQNDFLGVEKRRWVMANNDDIPVITSQQLVITSYSIHYTKLYELGSRAKEWPN